MSSSSMYTKLKSELGLLKVLATKPETALGRTVAKYKLPVGHITELARQSLRRDV